MEYVQEGMRSSVSVAHAASGRSYFGEMGPDTAVVSRLE
jgi:hypothetical protein